MSSSPVDRYVTSRIGVAFSARKRQRRRQPTFFRETAAHGDLSRMQLTPTRANGRPAVVVQRRTEDLLRPHGILVLEISNEAIVGIDAFINSALLPRFGVSVEARRGDS